MNEPETMCNWCESTHAPTYACDAMREVLARLHEKTMGEASKFDIPSIELTNEVGEEVEGILCKALGVRAFYTDTLKVYRPGIAIDAILLDDTRIKPLLLVDTDTNIRRAGRLVDDMCGVAVRRARKAREEAHGD